MKQFIILVAFAYISQTVKPILHNSIAASSLKTHTLAAFFCS
jgi:putative effector of murein hydrolase LrgA (UPF0299 family)